MILYQLLHLAERPPIPELNRLCQVLAGAALVGAVWRWSARAGERTMVAAARAWAEADLAKVRGSAVSFL